MSDVKPANVERQETRRIDSAGPDYGEPKGQVSLFRHNLRAFLENLKVEFFTMGIVIIYMLLIFADLMLADDPNVDSEAAGKPWTNAFKYIDMVFLTLFTVELSIRLFAFGYFYLFAPLNVVDGLVVLVSFGLQAWVISLGEETIGSEATTATNLLSIARVLRLVRLFVVMNKVQKARAAYKKTKYLKTGSPVERVIDLLGDMKGKVEDDEDKVDIQWIMDLIASDKLYTINIKNVVADVKDKDMAAFLSQEMNIKKDVDLDADGDSHAGDGDDMLEEVRGGLIRQQSSWAPGDLAQDAVLDVQRISELDVLQPYVERINEWDVDIFGFWEASEGMGLVVGTYHLLEQHNLVSKFRLSKPRLMTFLHKMQDGYRNANPYHNVIHALDVLVNLNYFLNQENLKRLLSPLDHLACLLAAAVHDFRHPGVNQAFLVATKHEYSITYSDQSVLESMHIASAWAILLTDECNFLTRLSKDQFTEFRSTIVQLVLSTDMKYHFEHTSKFKTKLQSDGFQPGCDREDVRFALGLALHTADIANAAKPRQLSLMWTEMVMEEFFAQGDEEKRLGLPISPFYDRTQNPTAKCQMGFINVLVKPLYSEFCGLLGEPALSDCLSALQSNLEGWEQHGNGMLKQMEVSFLGKGLVGPKKP